MKSKKIHYKRSVLHEGQSRKLEYVKSGTEAITIRGNQQEGAKVEGQ